MLTNCMVLTEGFDSQPVGCIGILRPMLHKGTFIQAVGRGLRRVDPARFPGIVKTDCVVLDFAGAALRHGSLEQEITLDEDDPEPGQAPWKLCPTCEAELPLGASVCDFCGHVFTRERAEARLLASDGGEEKVVMIDVSSLKAHRTASSLRAKKGGGGDRLGRLIGRTKGGMNTKPHAVTDARGRPLRFFMTAGQVSDYTGAAALLGSLPAAEWLIADRGMMPNGFGML